MNLIPGLNWLTSIATRRTPAVPARPDPADMGTAFGLDASMAPEPPQPTKPAAGKAAPPPANDRLTRRPRR